MHRHGISGFCTRQWMISDHDPVRRLSEQGQLGTPAPRRPPSTRTRSVRSCGEAAVGADARGVPRVGGASPRALEDHGMGLTFPAPGMLMQYWSPGELSKELREDGETYRRILTAVRQVPVRPQKREELTSSTGSAGWSSPWATSTPWKPLNVPPRRSKRPPGSRKKSDQPNAAIEAAEAFQQAQPHKPRPSKPSKPSPGWHKPS